MQYSFLQLDEGFLPTGFVRADIKVDEERHLLFATDKQLPFIQGKGLVL